MESQVVTMIMNDDENPTAIPNDETYNEANTAMSFMGLGTCFAIIVLACACVLSARYFHKYTKLLSLHDLCRHYWHFAWVREECCGYDLSVAGSVADTISTGSMEEENDWEPPPYAIALGMKRVDSTTIMGDPPPMYTSIIRNPQCFINISQMESTEGICGSAGGESDLGGSPGLTGTFTHLLEQPDNHSSCGSIPTSPDGIIITVPLMQVSGSCEACLGYQCQHNISQVPLSKIQNQHLNLEKLGEICEAPVQDIGDETNSRNLSNVTDNFGTNSAIDSNLSDQSPCASFHSDCHTHSSQQSNTISAIDTELIDQSETMLTSNTNETDQSHVVTFTSSEESSQSYNMNINQTSACDCAVRPLSPVNRLYVQSLHPEELPSYEDALQTIQINSIDL